MCQPILGLDISLTYFDLHGLFILILFYNNLWVFLSQVYNMSDLLEILEKTSTTAGDLRIEGSHWLICQTAGF